MVDDDSFKKVWEARSSLVLIPGGNPGPFCGLSGWSLVNHSSSVRREELIHLRAGCSNLVYFLWRASAPSCFNVFLVRAFCLNQRNLISVFEVFIWRVRRANSRIALALSSSSQSRMFYSLGLWAYLRMFVHPYMPSQRSTCSIVIG